MKKWSFVALLLVGATVLAATVFREPIAWAAQSISATIVSPLDGSGNVAVHEQGTANVNVTNSSLSVAPVRPAYYGGDGVNLATPGDTNRVPAEIASALSIHLNSEVGRLQFLYQGAVVAHFFGPSQEGNSSIVLALGRPITFDRIVCEGAYVEATGGFCSVSWVGAKP